MINDYDLSGNNFWKLKIYVLVIKYFFEVVDSWCLLVFIYNYFVVFFRKFDNFV